jgi:Putative auto-transporter adhesin, head GIN domain
MTAARIPSSHVSAGALLVAALFGFLSGQPRAADWDNRIVGSGVPLTESRPVSDFHNIVVGVDARVEIRQGTSEALSITGDDNIVPLVEAVVDNGTLKIRWAGKRHLSTSYKHLDIVLNIKAVDAMTISGSGDIHASALKTTDLRATISGSGDIGIDALDAHSLSVVIAGSGDVKAAGRADTLDATVNGSGDLDAAKLETRTARVTMSGSGSAAVWAKDTLSATVAGSGDITYRGQPQVSRTVMGSGSVSRARDAS